MDADGTPEKKRKSPSKNEKKHSPVKKKKKEDGSYTEISFKLELRDPNLTFTALETFVKNAQDWTSESGYDIVAGYCRSSAECSEIFQILEAGKRKATELHKIFGALEAIMLRVLDDLDSYKMVGQNIVRKLLTAHMNPMYFSLGQQNKSSQIKTTLKLLTTMVMLGEGSAKAVLAQVDFSHHNFKPLFTRRNSKDPQDVRTCMLHFIMAFFMVNSDAVVKQILEVKGFIGLMFEGMVFDESSTLHAVLDTLLEKVIRNSHISKTLKVRVFNELTLKHLRQLYFWKGPEKWSDRQHEKKTNYITEEIDEDKNEVLKSIAELVHNILLELCCSYNHGIVFSDKLLGISGKNQNHILTGFLSSCTKSLDHKRTQDLITRTLRTCPGQLSQYLPTVLNSIVPRPSTRWCSNIDFLCKIYENQSDKCPALRLKERHSQHQLVNMLLVPVLPIASVLQNIQQALMHKHLIVRHYGIKFFKTLVQKAVATIKFLNKDGRTKMEEIYSDAEMDDIIAAFKEQFFKAMPDRKIIFTCWKKLISPTEDDGKKDEIDENKQTPDIADKEIPKVEVNEHMVIIEQVLCFLQELSPSLLDDNPHDVNNLLEGLRILAQNKNNESLKESMDISTELNKNSSSAANNEAVDEAADGKVPTIDKDVLPQVYFLKLLSGTDARKLPWVKQSNVGNSLMYLLLDMMSKIPHHDRMMSTMERLMCQLVISTGLFEHNKAEVLLWFRHFTKALQSCNKDTLINFLSKIFTTVISNPLPYIDKVSEFMATAATMAATDTDDAMDTMSVGTTDSAINNILEMDDEDINDMTESTDTSSNTFRLSYSPLMIVALEILEKNKDSQKDISQYLADVLIDLVHIQQDPQSFITMIQSLHNNTFGEEVMVYLLSFSPAAKAKKQKLTKKSQLNPLLADLSRKLITFFMRPGEIDNEVMRTELKESLPDITTGDVLLLVSQIVLYIHTTMIFTEAKKGKLNRSSLNTLWEILDDIITFVAAETGHQKSDSDECKLDTDIELSDFRDKPPSEVLCDVFKCILGHPTIHSHFLYPNDIRIGCSNMEVTTKIVQETTSHLCDLSCHFQNLNQKEILSSLTPYFEKIITNLDKLDYENFSHAQQFLKQSSIFLSSEQHKELLKRGLQFPLKEMIDKKSTCLSPTGEFVAFVLSLLQDKDKNAIPKIEFEDAQVLTSLLPFSKLHSLDLACFHLFKLQPHLSVAVDKTVFLTCIKSSSAEKIGLAEIILKQNSFARKWFEDWITEKEADSIKIQLLPVSLAYVELFSRRETKGRTLMEPCMKRLTDLYLDSVHLLQITDQESSVPDRMYEMFSSLLRTTLLHGDVAQDLCTQLTAAVKDIKSVNHHHVKLLSQLCRNTLQPEGADLLFQTCYNGLIGVLNKKKSSDSDLVSSILNVLLHYKQEEQTDVNIKKIGQDWPAFAKVLLKYLYTDGRTFKLICQLLPAVYEMDINSQLPVSTLYEMIVTHSQFLPTMFNEEHLNNKEPLVDLMTSLVEIDATLCQTQHISILLGSYNATLASSDQKILKLLSIYEQNGADLKSYRPYLWGQKAIEHHTVKKTLGPSLWKQPTVDQVLEYLDNKKLQTSILNFPLRRKLQPSVVQEVSDCQSQDDVYDPCFILPLFSQLLSPDCLIDCRKFIDINAMGYVFAALSSHESSVRGAAYHLLSNFVPHLQGSHFQEKQQVEYLMQLLQDSLEKPNIKLPCIITIFMARAAKMMLRPDDHMYKMVNMFLLIKPTLDISNVPEFYKLFNSSALEYKMERDWILSLLAEGLRETSDYRLFEKRYVLKILLTYHDSALSDSSSQIQILRILRNACKGRTMSREMVKNHDIISWIAGTISTRKLDPPRVDIIVDTVHNLWFTMLGNKDTPIPDGSGTRCLPLLFTKSALIALQALLTDIGIGIADRAYIKYLETLISVLSHLKFTIERLEVQGQIMSPPTLTVRDVCLLLYNTGARCNDSPLCISILRILKALKYNNFVSVSEKNVTSLEVCSSKDCRGDTSDIQAVHKITELTLSTCLFWRPQLGRSSLSEYDNINNSIASSLFLLTSSWVVQQMMLSQDGDRIVMAMTWIYKQFTEPAALIGDYFTVFTSETRKLLEGLIHMYAIMYNRNGPSDMGSDNHSIGSEDLIYMLNKILGLIFQSGMDKNQDNSKNMQKWKSMLSKIMEDENKSGTEVENMSVLLRQYFLAAKQPVIPIATLGSQSNILTSQSETSKNVSSKRKISPKKKRKSVSK